MAVALTTVDLLAESIQHTFFAINALILASDDNAAEAALLPVQAVAAPDQRLRSIIDNSPDLATSAMALALFERPLACYLRSVQFSVPCYTMSRKPFFSFIRTGDEGKLLLHSHVPTFWQRLLNVCHVYQITIGITLDLEIGGEVGGKIDGANVRFSAPDSAQTVVAGAHSARLWRLGLTPQQEQQLLALPKIVARATIWWLTFAHLRTLLSSTWSFFNKTHEARVRRPVQFGRHLR